MNRRNFIKMLGLAPLVGIPGCKMEAGPVPLVEGEFSIMNGIRWISVPSVPRRELGTHWARVERSVFDPSKFYGNAMDGIKTADVEYMTEIVRDNGRHTIPAKYHEKIYVSTFRKHINSDSWVISWRYSPA